ALVEVDALVDAIFARHFGDARDRDVQRGYLDAMHAFATGALPHAGERAARIAGSDARESTAGRHIIDGDLMWFAWAVALEAAIVVGDDRGHARRALQLA